MAKEKAYLFVNETCISCECKKDDYIIGLGKENINPTSGSRRVCTKCNSVLFASKSNYIRLPNPMTISELQDWLKKNKSKFMIGKDKVLALNKNIITYTTEDQKQLETKKKEIPEVKEKISTSKGYEIMYYGSVLRFNTIPKPTGMQVNVAFVGKRILVQDVKIKMLATLKGNMSAEEYIRLNLKDNSGKGMFRMFI